MTKSFTLHDETVNTYGFRMLTSGAKLDEFRKNPVMLLNHNDWSMPIGRWENIRIEGGKILADPVFDDQDVTGREVKGKIDRDFIRMASIGAWPPEEVSEEQVLKLEGQRGPTVTKWTVREASIVTIGSNHNALAFWDRHTNKLIDLSNRDNILKLFDQPIINHKNSKMKELAKILNLADTASESEVAAAIRQIMSDRDRLKSENTTLSDRIDALNKAKKDEQKAEAAALVDAAIKDGRLDAKAKDSYLKLFDNDFDSAKAVIDALPKRKSVTAQLEAGAEQNATELADLQKKSWAELDKAGKLVTLRDKYPDLYKQKFTERFGVEPKNV
jgi:hypothetical protein